MSTGSPAMLFEQARPRVEPLIGQALDLGLALLVVDFESELLPKISTVLETAVVSLEKAPRVEQDRLPFAPFVLPMLRSVLAVLVLHLSDAKGFADVAAQLREPPPKGKVQVVTVIGGRVALLAVPVLVKPGAGEPS